MCGMDGFSFLVAFAATQCWILTSQQFIKSESRKVLKINAILSDVRITLSYPDKGNQGTQHIIDTNTSLYESTYSFVNFDYILNFFQKKLY